MSMTTKRAGSWKTDTATRQITELAAAFREFSTSVPGLTVEIVGNVAGNRELVHPVAGFHVKLPDINGTGVSLYVSSRYAELVRWVPAAGALRERFHVFFDDPGYEWGDTTFPSARELAHDLVAYMQFNLDALKQS
ncbi:MAG TPA: hypothetical protein VMN60_07445 [Longimicrobiales bacterium]|nr:hypothetical protein [Longimicrobiales bacterium]